MTLLSDAGAQRLSKVDWRWHCGALAGYACISWLVISHGACLSGRIFGRGADPFAFIWFLAWFPFAFAHQLNPFWSHFVWQPQGLSLLWMSSVPLLAIAAAPLTIWLGPVTTYNLLVLSAPVLSAWCMYRLCLRLTPHLEAALMGGFLFGFSTYEIAQVSILNLSYTVLLPCLGWIVLARLQGSLGRLRAIALVSAGLFGQFLISTEIFAMTVVFGGITWGLALLLLPSSRAILRGVLLEAAIAGFFSMLLLSPFLWSMFANYPYIHLPELWPYFYAASPTAFFVPGPNTLLGWAPAYRLVNQFSGDVQELNSYLGLPLLFIIYVYARENWHDPVARLLSIMVAVLMVLSLGPHLWLGEAYTAVRLPWAVLMRLPLLNGALPVRFALFVGFFASLILCLWVSASADQRHHRNCRIAGLIACLAIWPAPHAQTAPPTAQFFRSGRVTQLLGPSPRILVMPFSLTGPSMFWQVESGFIFSQTAGYLGFPPRSVQHFQVIWDLVGKTYDRSFLPNLKTFCFDTGTQYIVAGPQTSPALITALDQLGWRHWQVDDVTIYTVPSTQASHG